MSSDNQEEGIGLLNSYNEDNLTDESDYEPVNKMNFKEAFCIMFGFTLGTGVLIISDTIRQLGLIAWIFSFISIVSIQCLTSYMLAECTRKAMENKNYIRDPYQAVAEKAGGYVLRKFSVVLMYIWDISTAISLILVAVSMIATFIPFTSLSEVNNLRVWITIIVLAITPIMYLGTYSDLTIPAIIAVTTSLSSAVLVIINCVVKIHLYSDRPTLTHKPRRTGQSFFISLGNIVFMTGAALTVANMTANVSKPEKVWQPVVSSYASAFTVFTTVGLVAYGSFDGNVAPSIVQTFEQVIKNNDNTAAFRALTLAIQALMLIHLVMVTILSLNPLYLHLEEALKVPRECNSKRVLVRSSCMLLILAVCLLIPQFQFAIGIAGGVPFTIMGILLPAFMYARIYEISIYSKVAIYLFLTLVIVFILGNLIVSIKSLLV